MKPKLNLPEFIFTTKIIEEKEYIFDIVRKKYVFLSDEEWVRQNIIHYLITYLNYPIQQLGIEKTINVFKTKKRPDIIIFGKNLSPFMIVECKKTTVEIDNSVFNQTLNYFLELKTDFFLLTNGLRHYCCKIENNKPRFINEIPNYKK